MNDPKTVCFKAYRLMQGQYMTHRVALSCVNHYETIEQADAARAAIASKPILPQYESCVFKGTVPEWINTGMALYEKSPWMYVLYN